MSLLSKFRNIHVEHSSEIDLDTFEFVIHIEVPGFYEKTERTSLEPLYDAIIQRMTQDGYIQPP